MAKIDAFFRLMNAQGASDLHMAAGCQPCLRIHGDLEPIKYKELDDEELMAMLAEIAPEPKLKLFEETGDIDFAYEIPGLGRYRANYFRQSNGCAAVFRQIPSKIMTIEQLGLPPITRRFAMLDKGLVLVTGATGSGKSTTLAAIVDYANKNRRDHILTIEDPIEFKHTRINCLINHREVGQHTRNFAAALRGALREDPDIILVGELRDLETIQLALEAAATGHLVLATLHTPSAIKTVDRIIDVFPTDAQEQVRTSLSESLKGVVSQTLFRRADGRGRVAALEIMVNTPAVANLIREGKTHQLVNVLQTGKKLGMQVMDDAIGELLDAKKITPEEAFDRAVDKRRFVDRLTVVPEEYRELYEEVRGRSAGSPAVDRRQGERRVATPQVQR
ncbi:MAG TPA: type IV pilus twitching motility protein PilT [Planctomycetota bacterium]|nr:type IV pilus twitching motility protein PilT [Planctomycetota bacterium]